MTDHAPRADGILLTVDGRPALRFERLLPHPVDRVWRAVSDPAELGRWFPATVDWTPTTGERIEIHGMIVEVVVADPHRRLEWTVMGERYGFELTPDGDGCRLRFDHVFDGRDRAAQTAAGWSAYLSRLDVLLDGGARSEEDAHVGWEDVHEQYAAAFDVDPGPGRAFIASHRAAQG